MGNEEPDEVVPADRVAPVVGDGRPVVQGRPQARQRRRQDGLVSSLTLFCEMISDFAVLQQRKSHASFIIDCI